VNKKKKIYIAGQQGMVGSAIYNLLLKKKYKLINCPRKKLDLTNQKQVANWFKKNKPDIVINAAGRVGGILDNSSFQVDYIYTNTMIGFNLIKSSLDNKVSKFINLGSACIYPRKTKQPIKERYLLSSYLEKSNEGYAIAKISTLKFCQHINNDLKKDYISLQPTNLYGEGDNFNLKSSHVLPALIRKFHEAKVQKKNFVEVWGSGKVKREFLHVKDLARAIYFCLNRKVNHHYVNVGSNDYLSIKSLAYKIKKIIGYDGNIVFNKKYPDGVEHRTLSKKILNNLGWKAKIKLDEGIKQFYSYYLQTLKN